MELLNGTGGSPKLPVLGKIFKWVIPALLIYGGIRVFNMVAPDLKSAMDSFWYLVVRIVPAALLIGLVALNWTTLNLWWNGWCLKLSSLIIAMDPISVMKGYLVTLRKKAANLAKTLLFIRGKKEELERLISKKQTERVDFERLALSAKKQNEISAATLNMQKAIACGKSIDLYTPIYRKYVDNTTFLEKLQESWNTSIDSIAFTIDIKTEEFNTLKSMFKGLKSIEDLTSSGSAEAQAFGESMKALEADVSQKIAYINDFEKKAQPILTNMRVQKQADTDEALELLAKLTKDDNLLLPDYKEFTPSMEVVTGGNAQLIKAKAKYNM